MAISWVNFNSNQRYMRPELGLEIVRAEWVAYGQGSYFALNASYSHKFARSDSQGHRYMFLAQVLVGQFTTVSSMILFQVFLGL